MKIKIKLILTNLLLLAIIALQFRILLFVAEFKLLNWDRYQCNQIRNSLSYIVPYEKYIFYRNTHIYYYKFMQENNLDSIRNYIMQMDSQYNEAKLKNNLMKKH